MITKNHNDIINEYRHEIQEIFELAGAIAPNIDDLFPSTKFQKCKTIEKKDKGKIGYVCAFNQHGTTKSVYILINNFKLGKFVFNSASFDKQKRESSYNNNATKKPSLIFDNAKYQAFQQKEVLEEKRKADLFKEKLALWENAATDINNHPYATKKQLKPNNLLRQSGQILLYPLTHSETGKICGIQTIHDNGEKRFYGQQKNAYAVLGDLEKASTIYLCEGYATANAITSLANPDERFAVVNALNCHNLVNIAQWIKITYFNKKLVIAADNDLKTQSAGKGNAGLWYGSLATMNNQATLLYPLPDDLPNTEAQHQSVNSIDWCDAWIKHPDKATQAFRAKQKNTFKLLVLERLYYPPKNISSTELNRAIKAVFHLYLADYPIKCDESALIETVANSLKSFSITTHQVQSLWMHIKKKHFAKALRAKTFSLTPEDERYTVQSFHSVADMELAVTLLKQQHAKAIFVTNAPMGTGKTQTLMMPHFKNEMQSNHHPVVITPTRALTRSISEKFDAAHYQQDRNTLKNKNGLAITINSIIHSSFNDFLQQSQSLFIDEYTQVLRAMTSGTVKPEDRQKTHQRLSGLIQQSQYTYIADADLNAIALQDLIQSTSSDTPIFVLTLQKKDEKAPYHFHAYPKTRGTFATVQGIDEALQKKEKLYIVTDSRKKIAILSEYIKSLSFNALVITAESIKTPEAQSFLKRPDEYLRNEAPDVVLVSPAIQSGLSIESDYFDKVFGLYTGTVTPSIFHQMMNRVRKPIPREIIVSERVGRPRLMEHADTLLTLAYEQYIHQWGNAAPYFNTQTGVTHIGKLSLKTTPEGLVIQGDERYERFERLSANLKALDNQQKNHAASFLALHTMASGATTQFTTHDTNEELKSHCREVDKTTLSKVNDDRTNALCGINTLTEASYQHYKIAEDNTTDELNALKRFEIAQALNINTVTPTDVAFIDNDGLNALENYQDLNNGLELALKKDEIEQQQAISKSDASMHYLKVALLTLVFETLGINKATGEGVYSHVKAKQVREQLRQNVALSRYVLFKLGLSINSALSDIAFINKILKKLLGLQPERLLVREGHKRTWYYHVEASMALLLKYTMNAKMLAEANKTTLNMILSSEITL